MSAIGDYVHYREQNYRIWGINRPRENYGNASHYVSSFHQYQYEKRTKNNFGSANYSELEAELRKNTTGQIMKDQQMLNLDYGQKIGQFRSMVIARATGAQARDYSKTLSKKSTGELYSLEMEFKNLQKDIDYINKKLEEGKTVLPQTIDDLTRRYKALQISAGRSSILGNIQQGLNDDAARTWKETLDGTLGSVIDTYMQQSAEAFVTKQLSNNITSTGNMTITTDIVDKRQRVYKTSDKTGTVYTIDATDEGWEFNSIHNRENILKGSMKNIYNDQYHLFTLSGQVNLGSVLQMLEVQGQFGTHWLNKHANHLDSSMDEDLRTAIIYEALTKNRSDYQSSGDFVFIYRETGQIEHMNFWNVLDREEFSITPNVMHKKLNNDWAGDAAPSYSGAFTRISNLLQQVHAMNLAVLSKPIAI